MADSSSSNTSPSPSSSSSSSSSPPSQPNVRTIGFLESLTTPVSKDPNAPKLQPPPEFDEWRLNTVSGFVLGYVYGGVLGMKQGKAEQIDLIQQTKQKITSNPAIFPQQPKNSTSQPSDASSASQQQSQPRRGPSNVLLRFGQSSISYSCRLGIFSSAFSFADICFRDYRKTDDPLNQTLAGALIGGPFMWRRGGKAMAMGAGMGAGLGFLFGLTKMGLAKLDPSAIPASSPSTVVAEQKESTVNQKQE